MEPHAMRLLPPSSSHRRVFVALQQHWPMQRMVGPNLKDEVLGLNGPRVQHKCFDIHDTLSQASVPFFSLGPAKAYERVQDANKQSGQV